MKKRSDFLWGQANGKKWVSKGFILIVTPNKGRGRRFGLTVSKRVSSKAVDRNRMKRRLRAIATDILPEYGKNNIDYIFLARPETKTRLYLDLQKDLKWCLKKLDIYNRENNPEKTD